MNNFEVRPWGEFRVLFENKKCKVKVLEINPGCSISLQSHRSRNEFWYVVQGHPLIMIKDKVYYSNPKDTYEVEKTSKHRIINSSEFEKCIIIEIQTGSYFGEDDIVRYEDQYGRNIIVK